MSKGALSPCPPAPVTNGEFEEQYVTVGNAPTPVKTFPLPVSSILNLRLMLVGHSDEGGRIARSEDVLAGRPAVGPSSLTEANLATVAVDGGFGLAFTTSGGVLTMLLAGGNPTETITWKAIWQVQNF